MPRHPQPREVAALKGAVQHDPQRYRNEVPKSERPFGEIPAYLSPEEKAIWFEIESYSLVGVLEGADRLVMESLCRLVLEMRTDFKGMPANRIGQMISCLGRLGMTPADRQKLGAPKKKDAKEDPFAEFN